MNKALVSFQGMGTDEDELNRVIISRCEVDMIQIKEEYETLMKRTLEKHIQVSNTRTSVQKTSSVKFDALGWYQRELSQDPSGIAERSKSTN